MKATLIGRSVFMTLAVLFLCQIITLPALAQENARSTAPALTVIGLTEGQKIKKGDPIVITAVGRGMDNDTPQNGDIRYKPGVWEVYDSGGNLTGLSGSWNNAPYRVQISTDGLPETGHWLRVEAFQQIYSGGWNRPSTMIVILINFEIIGADVPLPTPPPVSVPAQGGSGGGSSSGSSSGAGTPLLNKAGAPSGRQPSALEPAEMARLAEEARRKGQDFVTYAGARPGVVTAEAWKALNGRKFLARTMKDGGVLLQLTFPNPGAVAADMAVGGSVSGGAAETVRAHLEKWFSNELRVLHLDQAGPFGQPVEVAVKLDLDGMDLENLVLYSYDSKTNTYQEITQPGCWADKNGYLHFTTSLAGSLVVSNGPLARK